MAVAELPDGLLIAYYGDDFTGASAVMEVLSFAGLPTVLFLEPPSPKDLARFHDFRAIGVAGVSRAQSPDWMDRELPSIFASLIELGAPVLHYKTCSTLDSSPNIGSIGRAIDLGLPLVQSRPDSAKWTPLVIGAPAIGRYQAFGNLFAAYAGQNYRLDRHPVMRRHPATPMDEADVALHVSKQTGRQIGLVDLAAIKSGRGDAALANEIDAGRSIVSLDVIDNETLRWVGRQIWDGRAGDLFAVGSQGVEYALVAHWRDAGLLDTAFDTTPAAAVDRIIAASGSVSPVTSSQIGWASENGFEIIALEAATAVAADSWAGEIDRAVAVASRALRDGRSVLLATARGPDDSALVRLRDAVAAAGVPADGVHARIGAGLGEAVLRLVPATGINRVALAGGDSSGYAARRLGIKALTALAPLAGGAPLCRAVSDTPAIDGLEIVLKGGQMGGDDFFGRVRAGRAIA